MGEIIQLKYSEIIELRDQLIKEQKNICPLCQKIINSPVLDHHHKKRIKGSGCIRQVLCRNCNIMLGKVENNCVRYCISQEELPNYLRKMAEYLEKPQTNYLHPSEAPKKKKLKKSSYKKLIKVVNKKQKIPEYPKSGQLTKPLKQIYQKYNLIPEFYS